MQPGPVGGAASWRGAELAGSDAWVYPLGPEAVAELEAAAEASAGVDVLDMKPGDFPLPGLAPQLARLRKDLLTGRGFAYLRGLPADRYPRELLTRIYFGIGLHVGDPVPQNRNGHMVAHVIDVGDSPDDPSKRLTQTPAPLEFHSDSADVAEDVIVGPNAVIGAGATIAKGCVIGPNSTVEDGVSIDEDTHVHANVFIAHGTVIGKRCEIHPMSALGTEGFGYAHDEQYWPSGLSDRRIPVEVTLPEDWSEDLRIFLGYHSMRNGVSLGPEDIDPALELGEDATTVTRYVGPDVDEVIAGDIYAELDNASERHLTVFAKRDLRIECDEEFDFRLNRDPRFSKDRPVKKSP